MIKKLKDSGVFLIAFALILSAVSVIAICDTSEPLPPGYTWSLK